MDLKFIFFIFLCIVTTTGGAFYYYSASQPITAALFFFGFIAFSVVFGLRWFTASGQVVGAATGGWPPVINYCPDFLTLYEVNGKQVCIDTIGVARQNGISKWTDPNQTSENYLFNLSLDKTGDARVKALCDECVSKKITWEGVHDGSICIGNMPPAPPAPRKPTAPAPTPSRA
jgi:hypothetical protein